MGKRSKGNKRLVTRPASCAGGECPECNGRRSRWKVTLDVVGVALRVVLSLLL